MAGWRLGGRPGSHSKTLSGPAVLLAELREMRQSSRGPGFWIWEASRFCPRPHDRWTVEREHLARKVYTTRDHPRGGRRRLFHSGGPRRRRVRRRFWWRKRRIDRDPGGSFRGGGGRRRAHRQGGGRRAQLRRSLHQRRERTAGGRDPVGEPRPGGLLGGLRQAYTVFYQGDSCNLVCPCHGSVLDPANGPANGPAPRPLPEIPLEVRRGDIFLA